MAAQKLILSRKGFDSTSQRRSAKRGYSGVNRPYGGVPSPIFPDGSMYSLPVPGLDEDVVVTYGDLYHDVGESRINIGRVVEDLTQNQPTRWTSQDWTYVSPDIREPFQSNIQGQTGIVGAAGAQQGHLRNQGVGKGDLFLFFGMFRRVEQVDGQWRFIRHAPRQHVLFGWLQIGSIHVIDGHETGEAAWYAAVERLALGDGASGPGAGVFSSFDERLSLSKPGGTASQWRLPRWFYPEPTKPPLTYHPLHLWHRDNEYAYVQRRGPGQEFVLDLERYPESRTWASRLVQDLG